MNWEKLFEPHILQRGYAYYRDGAVTEISAAEDAIEATVEGSEDYSVEVSLKKRRSSGNGVHLPLRGEWCVLQAYGRRFVCL